MKHISPGGLAWAACVVEMYLGVGMYMILDTTTTTTTTTTNVPTLHTYLLCNSSM